MDRSLKFRAYWACVNKIVYFGSPHLGLDCEERWGIHFHAVGGTVYLGEATVEQFTGLQDKNGKDIYEGDIVEAWSQGRHAICEVKWGVGSARFFLHRERSGIVWNMSGGGKEHNRETAEVIGNIHETPELLDGER